MTIEVPEGFEDSVKALEETLKRAHRGVEGASRGDLAAFDAAWQEVNAGAVDSTGEPMVQLRQKLCWKMARF
ncbi:hypothetical protein [Myxococcus xanthus]|uniref:hypothetical protein n=1 Tax=Myxococcus xanthus TaxID=34 RepID=UPI001375D5B6|nr:hypothetical protein [Myxococcus xanthus]